MKRTNNGFTLIELIIVLAIVAIILAIAFGPNTNSSYSWGMNGGVESRCVDGYKHVIGENGHVTQVMDSNGHGITCD